MVLENGFDVAGLIVPRNEIDKLLFEIENGKLIPLQVFPHHLRICINYITIGNGHGLHQQLKRKRENLWKNLIQMM